MIRLHIHTYSIKKILRVSTVRRSGMKIRNKRQPVICLPDFWLCTANWRIETHYKYAFDHICGACISLRQSCTTNRSLAKSLKSHSTVTLNTSEKYPNIWKLISLNFGFLRRAIFEIQCMKIASLSQCCQTPAKFKTTWNFSCFL